MALEKESQEMLLRTLIGRGAKQKWEDRVVKNSISSKRFSVGDALKIESGGQKLQKHNAVGNQNGLRKNHGPEQKLCLGHSEAAVSPGAESVSAVAVSGAAAVRAESVVDLGGKGL